MSTTTKNTLFDISCPDPVLRDKVYRELIDLDVLQANPVSFAYQKLQSNHFLHYGQGHFAFLEAVNWIKVSTNPINISNGLLSEFFILIESLDQTREDNMATDAYSYIKNIALSSVNIVHIHIRFMPGNNGRRMALSLLQQTVKANSNEQWFTFETPDVDAISKQIIELMQSQV